jgi:hypothetical protein
MAIVGLVAIGMLALVWLVPRGVPQLPDAQPRDVSGSASQSSIGTNVGKLGSPEMLWLVDQRPTAGTWLTQCDESCGYTWDTGEQRDLVLDEHGWVVSFGNRPGRRFTHVALALFNGAGRTVPAGDWVIRYDGHAQVDYDFAPFVVVVSRSPGRDVIRIAPEHDSLLRIRISQIDPTDHLRNLRVLPPGGICGDSPFAYAADAAACPAGTFHAFEQLGDALRFHPLLLRALQPYRTLRFMQFQGTVEVLDPEPWAQRSRVDDALWGDGWTRIPPIELIVELSNLLGAEPWVNMPYWADDAYVRAFAQLARERLVTTLPIWVEYANEVWNGAYPFSLAGNQIEAWAVARWPGDTFNGEPISRFTKRMNYVGMRSAQICAIWREVWGADASRVRCVMPGGPFGFAGSEALACPLYAAERGGQLCAAQMSALAIAPYFGGYISDLPASQGGHFEQLRAWTANGDGGLDALFEELRTGSLLNSPDAPDGAIAAAMAIVAENRAVAQRFGLPLVAYEAGQHLTPVSPLGTSCDDWNADPGCPPYREIQDLFVAANRDPRMGQLYRTYLDAWRAAGGTLLMHYQAIVRPFGRFGSWGAQESATQLGSEAVKYQAIRAFIAANPCWWSDCRVVAPPPTVALPTATRPPGAPTATRPPGAPTATRPPGAPTATRPPGAPTATRPPGAPTATRPPGAPTATRPPGAPTATRPPGAPTATPAVPGLVPVHRLGIPFLQGATRDQRAAIGMGWHDA